MRGLGRHRAEAVDPPRYPLPVQALNGPLKYTHASTVHSRQDVAEISPYERTPDSPSVVVELVVGINPYERMPDSTPVAHVRAAYVGNLALRPVHTYESIAHS